MIVTVAVMMWMKMVMIVVMITRVVINATGVDSSYFDYKHLL